MCVCLEICTNCIQITYMYTNIIYRNLNENVWRDKVALFLDGTKESHLKLCFMDDRVVVTVYVCMCVCRQRAFRGMQVTGNIDHTFPTSKH